MKSFIRFRSWSLSFACHEHVKWSKGILVFLIACTLMGCGSTKHLTDVQIVERVKQDTIYLSNAQYDSIFIQNDHSQEYIKGVMQPSETATGMKLFETVDTIHIRDVSIQYKYKLLRDTVYKVESDSIPVIKEVEVTKEIRYIPWWSKVLNWIGAFVIIILIIYLIYRIMPWKTKL